MKHSGEYWITWSYRKDGWAIISRADDGEIKMKKLKEKDTELQAVSVDHFDCLEKSGC